MFLGPNSIVFVDLLIYPWTSRIPIDDGYTAICLWYTLTVLVMQKTNGRGGFRSGVRYYFF